VSRVTTIGQLLVEDALPKGVKSPGLLDKSGMGKLLSTVAQTHPQQYGEVVKSIRDVGNQVAFETGSSFTLEDLEPKTGMRDAAFEEHEAELLAARKALSADPRSTALQARKIGVLAKIEETMNKGIGAFVKKAPDNLTAWVASGARGDVAMARQMVGMAGMNLDAANRLIPEIAKRSLSEGLSPIDFHVHAQGARRGLVNTYLAVRDPGAFAKELNTIHMDMLVTGADCGTTHGREMLTSDPDIVDRCLAQDVAGVGHRNDVITTAMRDALVKRHKTVQVRSPLTCTQVTGVCAHCLGLNEEGRLPPVGEHVGLKAAQALTEPLTQLALNQKHTGGVVGAGRSPLQKILTFMHAPKNFPGAAPLARASGTITSIDKAAAGGYHVHIGELQHYVGPESELLVKPGQAVAAGDVLGSGQPNPVEVVAYKGMQEGRRYFADELKKTYADAGIRGQGRIFETVARGILNLGQVVSGGRHDYTPGEMVHWNAIQEHLPTSHESVATGGATGRILAQEAGGLLPYTTLTATHVEKLKKLGLPNVPVFHKDALVVRPVMLGTERAALHKDDWLANLAFRFVNRTFKENAATGAKATVGGGFNPIPTFVYGQHFGEGKGGRY
jgi:DNA-directed RNA polymerase subunit beta'